MSEVKEKTFFIIKRDSREWDSAWRRLYEREDMGIPTDDNCPYCNKQYNECWQYMGTIHHTCETSPNRLTRQPGEPAYWHQFRHRAHPIKNERRYYNIPASAGWEPDENEGY